jgi:hypothetical protein
MNVGQKIKSLLHEAELYRTQGLLRESIGKYQSAIEILKKLEKLKNRDSLLEGVQRKIRAVEKEYKAFIDAPVTPEMDAKIQDLIKDKFAFAKEGEGSDLEGAIALAKFGQYKRALSEFRSLLAQDAVRMAAAKNILRCHLSLETYDEGVAEFQEWSASSQFTASQLENLRVFFQGVLDKKGVKTAVALPETAQPAEGGIEAPELSIELEAAADKPGGIQEEELLDISSIGILMTAGKQKGERVEFDVSFQSGTEISLLVASRDKELIEHMTVGTKLDDIEFYSPFAMFQGKGIVTANTKIATGPKRGDFSLDIKVTGT